MVLSMGRDITANRDYRLPQFEPVTQTELKRIWAENPCPEARRLVLEIERYRRILVEVEDFYEAAHKRERESGAGHSTLMHTFKNLIYYERNRVYRPKAGK